MAFMPGTIVVLAGPTAAGKSEVALLLAERLRAEIVSVDSMQVYRGLDIGTAKPPLADRARVPHHLIDVVDLSVRFDAAQFVRHAREAICHIQARGGRAILCGGTGLYFNAFFEGLGEAPPADPVVRAGLEATPLNELLRELGERDPVTFERIDRQNRRRVVRALEACRVAGRPFSSLRAHWGSGTADWSGQHCFGLCRQAEDLRCRIDLRVEEMFGRGLIEETEELMGRGLAENPAALQALGYGQVVEYLRGERSLEDTVELVKIRTRQFAKRQMTWFRRRLPLRWIALRPEESSRSVAERLLASLNDGGIE